jgi:hypothetical protein
METTAMKSSIRAWGALALAAMTWTARAEQPVLSGGGDVLVVKLGALAAEARLADGSVSLQFGEAKLSGKGGLFVVRAGPDGVPQASKLTTAAPAAVAGKGVLVGLVLPGPGMDGAALVVAPFPGAADGVAVPLSALGLEDGVYASYSPADNSFSGPRRGLLSPLAGAGLVFVARCAERPALIATSATMPGPERVSAVAWDGAKSLLAGSAAVQEKERFELRLLAPPEPVRWLAEAAAVSPEDAQAGVRIDTLQTRQWLRVIIESPTARTVRWSVTFAQKPAVAAAPPAGNVTLTATAVGPRLVQLRSSGALGDLVARRDDGAEIALSGGMANDRAALPGRKTTYTLLPSSWAAAPPAALATAEVTTPEMPPRPPLPNVFATDVKPVQNVSGWNGAPRRNLSIDENPLRIRGETFTQGIGTHAVSEISYKVRSDFRRFVALVGVDDEKDGAGTVSFSVCADDKPLVDTGKLTTADDARAINVEIPKGTKLLRLLVGDAGDGVGCDHADWANAGFMTEGEPQPEELLNEWLEPGFTALFNGKDLTDWDGDPRLWSAQDGAIRGETTAEKVAAGNTFLIWRGGILKDFVLKLKFRIADGNSGVQYRSKDMGDWKVSGYQAEVENTPGKVGFLYDESARGWLVNVGDTMTITADGTKQVTGKTGDKEALIKAGYYKDKDWNQYTITARGRHLVHQLNGYTTMELTDNDAKGFAAAGIFALQIHAGPPMRVEFKDIQLKQLQAEYGDPIALFNGRDLEGWTVSNEALKDTFGVKDGAITDTGNPAGYLRTTADYTNYVLRLQLRHVSEGNCGVLLRLVGPDKVWPRSIEAQGLSRTVGDIFNIDEFPMKTAPGRTNGRHTPKLNPSNERPLGEWDQYEITLDGGDLDIRVNDLLQNEASECWETAGKIGLQSEGAQMEFRNVTLIPITKTSAPAAK